MEQGNIAFVLVCAAFAMLAIPGAVFFYGAHGAGQGVAVKAWGSAGLVVVLFAGYGYAIAFADAGAPSYLGIAGVIGVETDLLGFASIVGVAFEDAGSAHAVASASLHAALAATAIVVLSAAVAGDVRTRRWFLFASLWTTSVYLPIAGWVFNVSWSADGMASGGWIGYGLADLVGTGALDFAGGMVLHIVVGAAALAVAFVVRPTRQARPRSALEVTTVLLGAPLLWVAWIGLDAGMEGAADAAAALVVVNALVAPAAALLAWLVVQTLRHGKPTAVGAASGTVAGLAAIAPACAYLTPFWAIVLGFLAGTLCALATDALSSRRAGRGMAVVGINVVGGLLGSVYLGFFAEGDGIVYSGRFELLIAQLVGSVAVFGYAFAATLLLGLLIVRTRGRSSESSGGRRDPSDEATYHLGMDDEAEQKRRDQLTSAPGDKWDDEAAAESVAPRIEVSESPSGATRIDVADTAAVRPGRTEE